MPLVMDTRPAAYAVIIEDDKILLTRWVPTLAGYQPGWTLPGGGLEVGEQPLEAMGREVFEETGYQVKADQLLGVHAAYFEADDPQGRPFCAFRTIYRAHRVSGSLRSETQGSTDLAQWVALKDLADHFYYSLVDEAARLLGYRDAVDLSSFYRKKAQG